MEIIKHAQKLRECYDKPLCRDPPASAITSSGQSWVILAVYTRGRLVLRRWWRWAVGVREAE